MRSKCNLILFRFFFWNHLGKQNARQLKRCVSYGRQVFHELLFQPMQMCKTFNVVPLPLTCPSRINLKQTNNFTVKSVKGVFHTFDSLIACRCNCCFQTICNSICWQLNCTAVTLSRLFKKNKLIATSQTWKLIKLCTFTTNGLCVVFFENRECNVLKLGIAAFQFSSSCWRTGPKFMLIPVSACD